MTVGPPPTENYTQMLATGGMMLAETRTLLQAWQPGESRAELLDQAVREDLLGLATAERARNVVAVFAMRYLRPDESPARHLKRVVESEIPSQVYSDLVFHYTAARDALLREFTLRRYWPAARQGQLLLTTRDAEEFIREGELEGRTATKWSEPNRRRMARVVIAALTDVGLLREYKPGKREIAPYRPADGTVVYLAYLLHDQDVTDASLAQASCWALYGLEPGDVWNRLDLLAGDGWFVVQRAGQVVRITWRYRSVEEALDALAG